MTVLCPQLRSTRPWWLVPPPSAVRSPMSAGRRWRWAAQRIVVGPRRRAVAVLGLSDRRGRWTRDPFGHRRRLPRLLLGRLLVLLLKLWWRRLLLRAVPAGGWPVVSWLATTSTAEEEVRRRQEGTSHHNTHSYAGQCACREHD